MFFLNLLCLRWWCSLHLEVVVFFPFTFKQRGLTKPSACLVGVWNQRCVVSAHFLLPASVWKAAFDISHSSLFEKTKQSPAALFGNKLTHEPDDPPCRFFFFYRPVSKCFQGWWCNISPSLWALLKSRRACNSLWCVSTTLYRSKIMAGRRGWRGQRVGRPTSCALILISHFGIDKTFASAFLLKMYHLWKKDEKKKKRRGRPDQREWIC